ncbi:MAG: HEPN domain-containing protein [Desulfurococcales archaeon]|nr:HEPN domain-containing protein [Desulfurococcales archaeon]
MRKPLRDIRLAEIALGEDFHEESAYHSQQAAEKALKALITAKNIRPPRTHDIDILIMILRRAGIEPHEKKNYQGRLACPRRKQYGWRRG